MQIFGGTIAQAPDGLQWNSCLSPSLYRCVLRTSLKDYLKQTSAIQPVTPAIHLPADTVLPASATNTVVACTWPSRVHERSSIKWHTQHDLVSSDTMGCVICDSLVSVEWCTCWVSTRRVDVSVMASNAIPTSRIVLCHEVPAVQVLIHL